LDLDSQWVLDHEYELIEGEETNVAEEDADEPNWRSYLAWFASLLRQALEAKATTIHLQRDQRHRRLRQEMFVPAAGVPAQAAWLEFVSMALPSRSDAIQSLRLIARMMPWSTRGVINYRYRGEWAKALCVQESADDLMVYLTSTIEDNSVQPPVFARKEW